MSGQCNKTTRIALNLAQLTVLAFHSCVLGLIPTVAMSAARLKNQPVRHGNHSISHVNTRN